MFATSSSKPLTSSDRPVFASSPSSPLKREHRVARVYEPSSRVYSPGLKRDFPNRPPPARTHAERPAPVLLLPGLPPRTFTPNAEEQERRYGSPKWYKGASNWLAQLRSPQSIKSPKYIQSPTPKTAHFVHQDPPSANKVKTLADFDNTLNRSEPFQYRITPQTPEFSINKNLPEPKYTESDQKDGFGEAARPTPRIDPPPLYRKHPPEGGRRGWMTIVGSFLIQLSTVGYLFTWVVYEDYYDHIFFTDQSPGAIRFIGCMQWFLVFGLSLFAGKISDLGFLQFSVYAGSLIFTLCLFLLSIVPQEGFGQVFLLQGFGMGIGIGLVFVPTSIVSLHYFKRRRALAISIVMSGGSFGGVIFPPVLRGLIIHKGFGGAVRITGFMVLSFLVIGNVLLVSPPKPEKPEFPVPHLDLVKYKQELQYVYSAGGTVLALLVIFFPPMYLELMGLTHGVEANAAFTSIVVLSLTGTIGRVLFGFLADLYGQWNMLLVVSGGTALTMFTMIAVQGSKSLVAESIFYGFFSAPWLSLMVVALSGLASGMYEVGTRVGLVFSLGSITFLFSPMLQFGLLSANQTWPVPCAIFGIILLGVTALIFFSRATIVINTKAHRRQRTIRGVRIL